MRLTQFLKHSEISYLTFIWVIRFFKLAFISVSVCQENYLLKARKYYLQPGKQYLLKVSNAIETLEKFVKYLQS